MKKASLIARYLLAAMLLVFGLNKFLNFMPAPAYAPDSPPMDYMGALSQVSMFPILGVIYIVAALLLVANKLVGLVCVTLAAVVFNILLFHLTIDPANIAGGLVFAVLLLIVMLGNTDRLRCLLK